ncbi:endonuclease/exonuclease/phosphatase family protein [Haliangium sp.]|uniref:sunset domain-containing protein n=1 Tax=Haliangium sp. TaxID=2663208 RepID=UPI003D100648
MARFGHSSACAHPPGATAAALALTAVVALAAGCREPDRERERERTSATVSIDSLELATWNLAWLHERSGHGTVKRDDADYARLAAYAARLDADVIALQEVASEAAARRVFDPALYELAVSAQGGAQRTGFAYRRGLPVTRHPDYDALDVGSLRAGTDITVHLGRRRLRLLAVHLKSGCWAHALGRGPASCKKLARQVPPLEAWIDDRVREGVAFAVLGDFNRRLDLDEAMWRDLDDGEPTGADLTLITAGRRSRCWGGQYPEYIDHIVLDARAATWLVPTSFEQLVYDETDERSRDRLSDHCPISIRLQPGGELAAQVEPGAGADPSADPSGAGPSASKTDNVAKGIELDQVPPGDRSTAAEPAPPPRGGPIKGNVSSDGRKLYHLPSCPSYARVRIDPDKGERSFATEAEARAAGFRKARNCP